MIKKITKIYLSFLFFLFVFFSLYSLRYAIYNQLTKHEIYSDTLTTQQITKAKDYLNQSNPLSNPKEVQKGLDHIFKSGNFQVSFRDSYDEDEQIISLQGRIPSNKISKFGIQIFTKDYRIDWYPSFKAYYQFVRITSYFISFVLSCAFYHLIKNKKLHFPKNIVFHSLSSKMLFTFVSSTMLVFLLFGLAYYNEGIVFRYIMDTFYENENYEDIVNKIQNETLNINLNKKNKKKIAKILKEHLNNHAYYYIYLEDNSYFTGKNTISPMIYEADEESISLPLNYSYTLQFKNQKAELNITSYPLVILQIPYLIVTLIMSFSLYMIILQSFIENRVQAIQQLQDDVSNLSIGDWSHEISIEDTDEIGQLAKNLNEMRLAYLEAMENEQESRQANQDLISSLSHDLRTPLTTLKGYLEILNIQKEDVEKRGIYLNKCLNKVEEITYLSNKMFEYSLVYSTEYNANLNSYAIQDFQNLIQEHVLFLQEMDLQIQFTPCENQVHILANPAMIQRILNNIFSNIQKYSDTSKPLVITSFVERNNYKCSYTNTINSNLDQVERNGIGLKSVKKMMDLHQGSVSVHQVNDLFSIHLSFPIHNLNE